MKVLSILALCIVCVSSAFADQYVGVNLGTNQMNITNSSKSGLKTGYKAGLKYGFKSINSFRAEIECTYRQNSYSTKYDTDHQDRLFSKEYNKFHSWAYMANGIFDLNELVTYDIVPYVGAGVGFNQNVHHKKTKNVMLSKTDSVKMRDDRFAYQGIVGVRYGVSPMYSTCIEYHYFCGHSHAKSHSVELGLLRHF